MGRRKITEEAEQTTNEQEASSSDESRGEGERMQTTWRADEGLVEELDEFADRYGMSRNAAITMLVRQGLEE
jgi:hypothetical protein